MICKHCNSRLSPKTKIHRCAKAGKLVIAEDNSFLIEEPDDYKNHPKSNSDFSFFGDSGNGPGLFDMISDSGDSDGDD